ncbi:MAG: hypothetical protein R3D89_12205 [Sphingomonadaceae bacterium]
MANAAWTGWLGAVAAVALLGPMSAAPARGEKDERVLPDPPANGVMGFVVADFLDPIVPGTEACPDGPSPKLRDAFLEGLSAEERARLTMPENSEELERGWRSQVFGAGGTNICSQPDMFDRPLLSTVQNDLAWGLDLDGDGGAGKGSDTTCAGEDFVSPEGMRGVDNQSYRVQGCKLEWRGLDGMPSDISVGIRQFHQSGEWTQVILLRGVDSLEHDPDVEVIYGNTPDRPFMDSKGRFLPGATFTISDEPPRHRNVLKGRIDNGVLTTVPTHIELTQTWGQGGARDIRGNRATYDYHEGRLRLEFQTDGSLKGLVGGYRPLFDIIISPSLGGVGSAVVAGIDCAAELKTLRKYADGMRNPQTGQCEGISSAQQITAVPAFVNDIPPKTRTAAR